MKSTRGTILAWSLILPLAAGQAAAGTVYLVRHAEKQQIANEPNPSLSEAGVKRAQALASALESAKLQAVFVTEYKRTQETAAPAAGAAKVAASVIDYRDADGLARTIKAKYADGAVLVVGHSDIARILKALGVKENVTVTEEDFDNLFVVDLLPDGTCILHWLHYGEPAHKAPAP